MCERLMWPELLHTFENHAAFLGGLAVLSLVTFLFSLVVVPVVFVKLPPDYLTRPEQRGGPTGWPGVVYLVLKNIAGWIFIVAGMIMLLIPGQGLLSILIGLMLIHFPGKRKLIKRVMGRPKVFRAVNGIRVKAGRLPLEAPELV